MDIEVIFYSNFSKKNTSGVVADSGAQILILQTLVSCIKIQDTSSLFPCSHHELNIFLINKFKLYKCMYSPHVNNGHHFIYGYFFIAASLC